MNTKDNVIGINSPAENSFNDPLTALAREGAQRMLAAAMEQEVLEFLEKHKDERTPSARQRFIRNGYLPQRNIQTGIGDIAVEQPRVRDRAAGKNGGFTDGRDCLLIIIGVTDKGQKEVIAIEDGYRESKDSWQALLRDLKSRGLTIGPKVATGDGALGFWAAISEEFPQTRHQRCWVHKTWNILDKLPKSQHGEAKEMLHEIWMAATKADALKAFDAFVKQYTLKYAKAVECLQKDKEELLTFYDFPAEHWKSLRTSNPIESTFATVRHRTKRSKGCFSRKTILTMVFKLCQSAQMRWIRLYGFARLAEVIRGVKFVDGVVDKTQLANDQSVAA